MPLEFVRKLRLALTRKLQLAFMLLAVLALPNCTSPQAIANARANGAIAGRDAGLKAGYSAGFAAAFPLARDEYYRLTLEKLYTKGEFHRRPLYAVTAICGALFGGFAFQYILLYLARRCGIPDIDRIVLPRHLTQLNLADLETAARPKRPHINCWFLLVALTSLTIVRCNEEENAWKQAYEAYYAAAYQEGSHAGELAGNAEGAAAGTAAARKAAQSGDAWQLYLRLAVGAFLSGITIGICLQYIILFHVRNSGRLDQLQTALLVPAMRYSLAYSIAASCVKLELYKGEALRKVSADSSVKRAELQAAHDELRRRVLAVESIDELTKARFVELADKEFAKIILSAENATSAKTVRRK